MISLDGRTVDDLLEVLEPTDEVVSTLLERHSYLVITKEHKIAKLKKTKVVPSVFKQMRFERYSTVPCKFVDTDNYPHTRYTMDQIVCIFKKKI